MTLMEVPLLDDVDLDLQSHLHWPCCRHKDRFVCGTPYHPEMDITDTDVEDTACTGCEAAIHSMPCAMKSPPHFHCPLDNYPCPFTQDGRRVRDSVVR